MKKQLGIMAKVSRNIAVLVFPLFGLLFVQCGTKSNAGLANPAADLDNGLGGDQDFNPAGGLGDLSTALNNIKGTDPNNANLVQGVDAAQNALNNLGAAYNGIQPGMDPTAMMAYLQKVYEAQDKLRKAAELLKAAGYDSLYEAFDDLSRKVPVYRMFNKSTGDRTYMTGIQNGIHPTPPSSIPKGYVYEHRGFTLYSHGAGKYESCNVALYVCTVNSIRNMTVIKNKDGGCIKEGGTTPTPILGDLCSSKIPQAMMGLYRFVFQPQKNRMTTLSRDEATKRAPKGTKPFNEGIHGYAPNY